MKAVTKMLTATKLRQQQNADKNDEENDDDENKDDERVTHRGQFFVSSQLDAC